MAPPRTKTLAELVQTLAQRQPRVNPYYAGPRAAVLVALTEDAPGGVVHVWLTVRSQNLRANPGDVGRAHPRSPFAASALADWRRRPPRWRERAGRAMECAPSVPRREARRHGRVRLGDRAGRDRRHRRDRHQASADVLGRAVGRHGWGRRAAQREAEEEIGLDPALVTFVAQLDGLLSRFGMLVTPFVATVPWSFQPRINPREVEVAFRVPLAVFLSVDPVVHRTLLWEEDNGESQLSHMFSVDGKHTVWGLTAAMLLHLVEVSAFGPLPFDIVMPGTQSWFDRTMQHRDATVPAASVEGAPDAPGPAEASDDKRGRAPEPSRL